MDTNHCVAPHMLSIIYYCNFFFFHFIPVTFHVPHPNLPHIIHFEWLEQKLCLFLCWLNVRFEKSTHFRLNCNRLFCIPNGNSQIHICWQRKIVTTQNNELHNICSHHIKCKSGIKLYFILIKHHFELLFFWADILLMHSNMLLFFFCWAQK